VPSANDLVDTTEEDEQEKDEVDVDQEKDEVDSQPNGVAV
jgi:hypothetical protein